MTTLAQDVMELRGRTSDKNDRALLKDIVVIIENLDGILHSAHDIEELINATEE